IVPPGYVSAILPDVRSWEFVDVSLERRSRVDRMRSTRCPSLGSAPPSRTWPEIHLPRDCCLHHSGLQLRRAPGRGDLPGILTTIRPMFYRANDRLRSMSGIPGAVGANRRRGAPLADPAERARGGSRMT